MFTPTSNNTRKSRVSISGDMTVEYEAVDDDDNQANDLCKYEALDESGQNDKKTLNKEFKTDEPRRHWTA